MEFYAATVGTQFNTDWKMEKYKKCLNMWEVPTWEDTLNTSHNRWHHFNVKRIISTALVAALKLFPDPTYSAVPLCVSARPSRKGGLYTKIRNAVRIIGISIVEEIRLHLAHKTLYFWIYCNVHFCAILYLAVCDFFLKKDFCIEDMELHDAVSFKDGSTYFSLQY